MGGLPLLSVMMLLLCLFLIGGAIVYDILLIRLIFSIFAVGAFIIGTLHFIFKDDLLFTESFITNSNDTKAAFAGGDEE